MYIYKFVYGRRPWCSKNGEKSTITNVIVRWWYNLKGWIWRFMKFFIYSASALHPFLQDRSVGIFFQKPLNLAFEVKSTTFPKLQFFWILRALWHGGRAPKRLSSDWNKNPSSNFLLNLLTFKNNNLLDWTTGSIRNTCWVFTILAATDPTLLQR